MSLEAESNFLLMHLVRGLELSKNTNVHVV